MKGFVKKMPLIFNSLERIVPLPEFIGIAPGER